MHTVLVIAVFLVTCCRCNCVLLFVQEDVDSFMKNPDNVSGAAVLQKLDEQLNKYRFMDGNLQQKKKRL